MRFVIYKNSVLATICSMFGAAFIVMAVTSMVSGELGILPGIGVIAAALGFMWLGDIISTKKAQRKRKKAQQAATAAALSPTASYAQPQQSAPVASHAASAVQGKRVNISAVFAAILFLLAALLEFIVLSDTFSHIPNYQMNSNQVSMVSMGMLMAIAAFRSRHIQQVSVLYIIGFLGLALGNLDVALNAYRYYGSGAYTTAGGIHYAMFAAPALKAAAYFLLGIFALLSTRKIKESCGGIVRWLWFVPMLALALALTKEISDDEALWRIMQVFSRRGGIPGLRGLTHPALLHAYAVVLLGLAVFISGFCFRRLCRKRAVEYTQPEPQSAYVPPVQETPVQPQPEPRYVAPEPPKQPEPAPKANDPDVLKQIQAYKDLLDCGILTREECEQKIRELTQEYYGG